MSCGKLQDQGTVKKCPKCAREFGFTLWKYNCHVCGLVVCDDCAPNKYVIPGHGNDPEKVCKDCERKKGSEGLKTADGGRKLGGGGDVPPTTSSEEAERERRAKLAEERIRNSSRRGVPLTVSSSGSSATPQLTKVGNPAAPPASAPIDRANSDYPTHDTSNVKDETPAKTVCHSSTAPAGSSNPVLEAALRRQQSTQVVGAPRVDAEKQLLLTEIHQVLLARGEQEPFGLRSMEATKLRLYLNHLSSKK